MRLLLSHIMVKEAYQVVSACDGAECLALCKQQLPDLILLDALMPVIDGFDCCAALQQQFGKQCPPVLMITSLEDQVSVDQAFAAGASDYITKPIHWAVLRQRVRRLLQMHSTIAELQQKMEQERRLMAQLEAANAALKRLATIDGLTQIANRRCFDECLEREWRRLKRDRGTLSLILCDIDRFKRYNDTYGHHVGDECLKSVARLLQHLDAGSFAARYGGEEFALILPNYEAIEAVAVARSIQATLRVQAIPAVEPAQSITLSFGITCLVPSEVVTPTDLIAQADRALYQAKQAGRDRIVVAED
ncbi:MAG: diguanylate cyclase [Leptolyngbyaceae cyanobacterium SM1_3_5]|nr:diguanylate cyclase [Leptolyngbyaceae cyanobacterium SM1_3_5]